MGSVRSKFARNRTTSYSENTSFDGAVEEREELGMVPKYSESVSELMLNNKKERITDIDQLFFISQIGTGLYGNVMLVTHKDDLMH